MTLLAHYKNLWFYHFHRLEDNNYEKMREYFADIFIQDVEKFIDLRGATLLDVGGANGEFCKTIHEKRQCQTFNLDPFPHQIIWPKTFKSFADRMPIKSNTFDILINRGVIEHIPYSLQEETLAEMFRVLKPGGICYLMTQPWYNPHAGHQIKPFHILPFKIAQFLAKRLLKAPRDLEGNSYADIDLYGNTFRKMTQKCHQAGFTVIATLDTHFRLHFLTRIPLARELFVPSVVWILKK